MNGNALTAEDANSTPIPQSMHPQSGPSTYTQSKPDVVTIPVVSPDVHTAFSQGRQHSPKQKKPGSKLLVIGIILCVIALAALAVILALVFLRPFSSADAPEPPQISEVESVFEDATIEPPKLDGYLYIKTDGLTNPALSEYKTGNVTEDNQAKGSFSCNGEAKATFQNDYVKAIVPLTVRMTHAAESTSWVPGGVDEGTPEVTPTGPADLEAMQANIQNILLSYNKDVAAQFVDCEVRPEASLNTQGGTVVFNLSKTTSEETKTCSVNTNVTWGNQGWNVDVSNITGLDEAAGSSEPAEPEETEEPANESSNNNNNNASNEDNNSTNLNPTMLLECWSGDLVRIPGTIQIQQNGSVLLRTDDVIKVVFDGRTYITTYFEITGSGTWQNGQHVIIDGAISATGTNPVAPLVINTNYV